MCKNQLIRKLSYQRTFIGNWSNFIKNGSHFCSQSSGKCCMSQLFGLVLVIHSLGNLLHCLSLVISMDTYLPKMHDENKSLSRPFFAPMISPNPRLISRGAERCRHLRRPFLFAHDNSAGLVYLCLEAWEIYADAPSRNPKYQEQKSVQPAGVSCQGAFGVLSEYRDFVAENLFLRTMPYPL